MHEAGRPRDEDWRERCDAYHPYLHFPHIPYILLASDINVQYRSLALLSPLSIRRGTASSASPSILTAIPPIHIPAEALPAAPILSWRALPVSALSIALSRVQVVLASSSAAAARKGPHGREGAHATHPTHSSAHHMRASSGLRGHPRHTRHPAPPIRHLGERRAGSMAAILTPATTDGRGRSVR